MTFTSERELGRLVVGFLRDLRWTVYQEVSAGGVADIVATQGPLLIVVELKSALTFDVIAQAKRWLGEAHRTYVAVPATSRGTSDGRRLAYRLCEELGVGVLLVRNDGYQDPVREERPARLMRRAKVDDIRRFLCEEQKTHAEAGSQSGHWTSFKRTCKALAELVKAEPGISFKLAVTKIPHHYASPKSALASLGHWIETGKVARVAMERRGRERVLVPTKAAAAQV